MSRFRMEICFLTIQIPDHFQSALFYTIQTTDGSGFWISSRYKRSVPNKNAIAIVEKFNTVIKRTSLMISPDCLKRINDQILPESIKMY